jgi:hypothetical protein
MWWKNLLDPEELTSIRWGAIIFILAVAVLLFCNWLNYAVWP